MKPLIVADENIPAVRESLAGIAEVRLLAGRSMDHKQLQHADALLVRSVTPVNATLLAGTTVKFVGTATSGYDHIDRDWLAAQGIAFTHAPGSNANSVVEYVLAAIAESAGFLERVLAGEPVGIVGYGHIGRALAARLRQLGIRHCVYDPWLPAESIPHSADLAAVLGCTVLSLHASLTREQPFPSHHLLGESELAVLGARQLLINAARGPVVDNRALLQRLRSGDAPSVTLDVWEHEPRVDVDLLGRVHLGSAHIAGYSFDGKLAATRTLVARLLETLDIEAPESPTPDLDTLQLAAADSAADALRQLLAQRYRLTVDDRRLREAVIGVAGESAARGFDRLRRDYPLRRELAGSRVALIADCARYEWLVRALGAQALQGANQ